MLKDILLHHFPSYGNWNFDRG